MHHDAAFRAAILVGVLIVVPIIGYHRLRSQATGEKLNRRQEGLFILATLRPAGLGFVLGLIAYTVEPSWMAWSSMRLPPWLRWIGLGVGAAAGGLLFWTLRALGTNLTDTVVTRREHTLVTAGPYRWVRHPFYDCVALLVLASSLLTANWYLLVIGALVVVLLVVRTRTEEEKLLTRFDESYRAYRDRTGRFVPKIGAADRHA